MQSGYTGHIVAAEWRWVILVGTTLVLAAFAPFIWITIRGSSQESWQFMGALHSYPDGATYLSKMLQGSEGAWLVNFQHTPEPHSAMFTQIIYALLGRVSRLISVSPIVMFHVARVGAALFMYMAIYQLGASIWMRVRTRRIFFVLASAGAGLGWFFSAMTGYTGYPDLIAPELFPFQSTAANVHFPLALACLALIASVVITAFRLGQDQNPTLKNGGAVAVVSSLVLTLLYPEAPMLIATALGIFVALYCLKRRRMLRWAVRWLLVVVLPAVPILVLNAAFLIYNPAIAEWNRQRVTIVPDPLVFTLSLGIPLLIALPGIYRGLRHFEPDGDQFMLIWLITMVIATYLPTNVHLRFAAGIMIPVAYFAARSLEDYWFPFVSRRWRYRLFIMVVPFMLISHIVVLFAPIVPVTTNGSPGESGLFLERDYAAVFTWLDSRARSTDVVLASPAVSLWLPAWVNARVVYGHPYETLQASTKRQAVLEWYRAQPGFDCTALLNGQYAFEDRRYHVSYVVYGPRERALGATQTCLSGLRLAATFGSVTVYIP